MVWSIAPRAGALEIEVGKKSRPRRETAGAGRKWQKAAENGGGSQGRYGSLADGQSGVSSPPLSLIDVFDRARPAAFSGIFRASSDAGSRAFSRIFTVDREKAAFSRIPHSRCRVEVLFGQFLQCSILNGRGFPVIFNGCH